jgi:hypothetical protein
MTSSGPVGSLASGEEVMDQQYFHVGGDVSHASVRRSP